jgi:uncharacterized membrane protein YkvA (DUF1232 family)
MSSENDSTAPRTGLPKIAIPWYAGWHRQFKKSQVITEVKMKIPMRLLEILRMISRFWSDLPLLVRLLKAWKGGSYRGLSVRTLASCAVALLYVLSPVDLIPDFIPGIGLIDDAAVLALLLHSLAQDLAAFRIWEERRGNG